TKAVARSRAPGMTTREARAQVRSPAMAGPRSTELIGAGGTNLRVTGTQASAALALDSAVHRKVTDSLEGVATGAQPAPDRVFLNLENVRRLHPATALKGYIT